MNSNAKSLTESSTEQQLNEFANDPAIQSTLNNTLHNADGGEVFILYSETESLVWEDKKVKISNFNSSQDYAIRAIYGGEFGYAKSSDFTLDAFKKTASFVNFNKNDYRSQFRHQPNTNHGKKLYGSDNPIYQKRLQEKVALMQQTDDYVRSSNPHVKQVIIRIINNYDHVWILKHQRPLLTDIKPATKVIVVVVLSHNNRMEVGSSRLEIRDGFSELNFNMVKVIADEAIEKASISLQAQPCPAGEMTVVLDNGWPGVLVHEAVGHPLEGDAVYKKSSFFTKDMIGQKVASELVTIIDDGTMSVPGAYHFDDEGNYTQKNILIENGILKGFLHDEISAKLLNMPITGSGRREGVEPPMPRMNCTYLAKGKDNPEDIIKSVKKGIYATEFGGGTVDPVSGRYNFGATMAYLIEDGRITTPVKGAMMIGSGLETINNITAVGSDFAMAKATGNCGKGQWVDVNLGQPTVKIEKVLVGGAK